MQMSAFFHFYFVAVFSIDKLVTDRIVYVAFL